MRYYKCFHYLQIVYVICERILQLCDCQDDNSPADIKFRLGSVPFIRKFISNVLERLQIKDNLRHSYSWAESLSDSSLDFSGKFKVMGNTCPPVARSVGNNDCSVNLTSFSRDFMS